ncbi:E3 ubiquitin-protein ligase [Armadillidium nasatum]|uniref:E3 ubiquitin-protein ligase n=1 Tax=Armadillidium nasatum TaxID=96803 RepID=A0A5N5T9B3_9CRUS|nr:E3 ubiquitin-protein ligase [Armadillidium nasatum]
MEEESASKCASVETLKKISSEEELECAVCLQSCVHPVRLPCSSYFLLFMRKVWYKELLESFYFQFELGLLKLRFSFIDLEGTANQSKRCAMCRQEIPADFLENPHLLKKVEEKECDLDGYQWFYEGRNGWWQYDERTSRDLESSFSRGDRIFEILVAGFLYTIDFDKMIQQRRNDPSRRRRIKRDLASIPKKGVAGLKTVLNEAHCRGSTSKQNTENSTSDSESNSPSRGNSNLEVSLRLSSEYQVLEYLHLLHSDLQRNVHVNRVPEASRTSWLSDISVNETTTNARRSRAFSTTLRNDCDSHTPEEQHQGNLRIRLYSDPPSPSQPLTVLSNSNSIESSHLEDTVNSISDDIGNLAIDSNDAAVQYYSLDDTVEYDLPTNNEDL